MSRRRGTGHRRNTDPRRPGGDIAGPGGPEDRNAVVLDTSKAVLLDHATAVIAHLTRDGQPVDAYALMLEGRINQVAERSRVLYLADLEGAADVVAHVLSLARRNGDEDRMMAAVRDSEAWRW